MVKAAVSVVVILANFLSVLQIAVPSLLSTLPHLQVSFLFVEALCLFLFFICFSLLSLLCSISCHHERRDW